jgi:hypothetical protein
MATITTMADSPWAKEWESLSSNSIAAANLQRAILLATFHKAFGAWPADIPQEVVEKLIAGRDLDEILRNASGLATLEGTIMTMDDDDAAPSPTAETGRLKRKRVDTR